MTSQSLLSNSYAQLQITRGLHSGVQLPLESGEYKIGSTAESDIVLRDADVNANHAIIRISGNHIQAEAIGGDFSVNGEAIAMGQGVRLRLPAEIELGAATLCLSRSQDDMAIMPFLSRLAEHPLKVAGGLAACVFIVVLVTRASGNGIHGEAPSQYALATSSTETGAAQKPDESSLTSEAAKQLRAQLTGAGIQTIKVNAANGRVLAEGTLTEEGLETWTSIQRWYDKTYGMNPILIANVSTDEASKFTPAFRLQAVYYGDKPYIITDTGTHYYENAILESGWVLENIGEAQLVLRKNDKKMVLTYD